MLNLALLGTAGLIILGIARYNHSNKLFWQLLMATLLGFAGGHISSAHSANNKSTKEIIDSPISCTTITPLTEGVASFIEDAKIVLPLPEKKSVNFYRDIVLLETTRSSAYNPDNDIGLKGPLICDTS